MKAHELARMLLDGYMNYERLVGLDITINQMAWCLDKSQIDRYYERSN